MPKGTETINALKAFEKKNIQLLTSTNKDLELLAGVYGTGVVKSKVKPAVGRSATSRKAR
jgi:hypothetical protein